MGGKNFIGSNSVGALPAGMSGGNQTEDEKKGKVTRSIDQVAGCLSYLWVDSFVGTCVLLIGPRCLVVLE